MLIGTAGHIDHGKTALVAALTGRNTDRLPEEKRRGISIELGFAFLPAGESSLAFIDVPGHEAFLPAMLAGTGGIDHGLLVVAANEGVMPQTREHFEVLRLLGVNQGTVVLSKTDRASAEQIAATQATLAALRANTPAQHWPVFATSAITGAGVEALRTHLQLAARPRPADGRPMRLAIDRVFTLAGRGTVVTGSLRSGQVSVGDALELAPARRVVRVRELRANEVPVDTASAGQRVALLLAGLDRAEVARGDWLVAPGLALDSARIDAWIDAVDLPEGLAERLPRGAWLQAQHGTREVPARVSALAPPAAEGIAVAIDLDAPLPWMRGDRLILREPSGARRLSAATVIELSPPMRGRRRAERVAALSVSARLSTLEALGARLELGPVALVEMRAAWPLAPAELDLALHEARVASGWVVSPTAWARWRGKLLAAVAQEHESRPGAPGIEIGRLARCAAPGHPAALVGDWVEQLLAEGALERRGAFLAVPGFTAEFDAREAGLWREIEPRLAASPFAPPRVRDLARATGERETELRALLKSAARLGRVAMVAHDHYFLASALSQLATAVETLSDRNGGARAAALRDAIGGGRKLAIQILEFFDAIGFTRRVGDEHRPLRSNPWRGLEGKDLAARPGSDPA